MIHCGFGNYIDEAKLVACIEPHAAPTRQLVRAKAKDGGVLDVTAGRITRSILVMDDGTLIRCALNPEIIAQRASAGYVRQGTAYVSPDSKRARDKRARAAVDADAAQSGG